MPIIDISVAITPGETPVYPGDPGVEIIAHALLSRGDSANVSLLRLGAHTATHVDAPAHFIEGAAPLRDLPLQAFFGRALVVEVPHEVEAIGAGLVESRVPAGTERVLFKTRNSAFWSGARGEFRKDFAHVAPDGARALVGLGVRLVGIDYLSVERFGSEDHGTHKALLGAGVVILEGLDLSGAASGEYELICLPLKLAGGSGDGAPARAVLRTLD
jgi:arylformamidase